jgi:hypothetical protein
MRWITRTGVKVDRTACAWLIKRFIDEAAEFHFAPTETVLSESDRQDAIPFDVPGVRFGHHDGKCSFDALLERYGFKELPMLKMAEIVRGADGLLPKPLPESIELVAYINDLAAQGAGDAERVDAMMPVYDAMLEKIKQRH